MDMNSLTSGDVLLFMLLFVVVAVSVWALLVGSSLIFRRRAEYARDYFEVAPWRTLIIGLLFGGGATFWGRRYWAPGRVLLRLRGCSC